MTPFKGSPPLHQRQSRPTLPAIRVKPEMIRLVDAEKGAGLPVIDPLLRECRADCC